MSTLTSIIAFCAIVFLSSCKTSSSEGDSDVKLYAKDGMRAEMNFESRVRVKFNGTYRWISEAVLRREQGVYLDRVIKRQLQNIMGALMNQKEPVNYVSNPGIPLNRPKTTIQRIDYHPQDNSITIFYTYSDIVLFRKSLFTKYKTGDIAFFLPESPLEIYKMGLVPIDEAIALYKKSGDSYELDELTEMRDKDKLKTVNLCTDLHYNSEGDFFYFWDYERLGCPSAVKNGLVKVSAKLKPMPSTKETYPAYDKLYSKTGNASTLTISTIIGIDETFKDDDNGVLTYKKLLSLLTDGKDALKNQDDYSWGDEENEFWEALPAAEDIRYKVISQEKRHAKLQAKVENKNVILDLYLAEPGSENFLSLAKTLMKNSDIFLYDGHSGLGSYLETTNVFGDSGEPLPANKYQIFFFHGCSTFSYYNDTYFKLKATPDDPSGIKNLNIVTAALPAKFSVGPSTDAYFLKFLVSGKRESWQKMIDRFYKIAGRSNSGILSINGDEDDPTVPKKQ